MSQASSSGERPPPAPRTHWHYPFVTVLEFLLRPRGFVVDSFVKVGTLPLEIDVVVIRREEEIASSFERLDFLFRRLGRVSIIEYKGPTDELDSDDLDRLFAYALLYRIHARVRRWADLTTFTVSSRVGRTYRESLLADGISLAEEEPGVLRGDGAPFAHYAIALDDLPETVQTGPLLPFGRLRKGEFARMLQNAPADRALAGYLVEAIAVRERFHVQLIPDEDLKRSLSELEADILEALPVERRLRGLAPEERLRGLAPEELAAALRGLAPEELAAALRGLPEDTRRSLELLLRGGGS